jgi:hypothetical protein
MARRRGDLVDEQLLRARLVFDAIPHAPQSGSTSPAGGRVSARPSHERAVAVTARPTPVAAIRT